MPPFIFPLLFIALIFTGVWGSMIVSALVKRLSISTESRPDDLEIQGMREEQHLLEARVERLEEDLGFFRELYRGESPTRLPSPEPQDP
jgi:hypothetical protein